MDEIMRRINDVRTAINAGCNSRGIFLPGETCKLLVQNLDYIQLLLLEVKADGECRDQLPAYAEAGAVSREQGE